MKLLKMKNNKKYFRLIAYLYIVSNFGISNAQQEVSINNLINHVNHLCSNEFEGRLPGTTAYDNAANYCVNYFQSIAIKPIVHKSINGYFQNFALESNVIESCNLILINKLGQKYELKLGTDYTCRGFTGSGKGIADVVFCGYGQAHDGYNDYRGMDLKGKAVVIFKSNPPFESPDTSWGTFSIRRNVELAKKQGAVAVIFVSRPNVANPQKPIGSTSHGEGVQNIDIPQFQLDIPWVDTLLLGTRYPLSRLDNLIANLKMPFSLFTSSKIEYDVKANYTPDAKAYNILGFIEGSDPNLKSEYIVVSAHLDHVGKQGNVIYPGANDNASGSAAVLEIARLISESKIKPARSIMFVLFTAEESGMDGSNFLALNLPVAKEKINVIFNMDCIAYGDSIQVGNGESYPNLWNRVKAIDEKQSKRMVEQTWKGGGADLTPFHLIGIPGLYFVSKNSYAHLHLPSDKPETLNQSTYKDLVQLVYLSVLEFAK